MMKISIEFKLFGYIKAKKILLFFSLIISPFVYSGDELYHPDMTIYLGEHFDELAPLGGKSDQFFNYDKRISKNRVQSHTSINMSVVKSTKELMDQVGINFSAEAHNGLSKASAKYSQLAKSSSFDETISIVFTARRKWQPDTITNIKLNDGGEKLVNKLIENDNLYELRKFMGSHIVSSVTKGASISVVYFYSSSDKSTLKKIEASFSGNASFGSASIAAAKQAISKDSTLRFSWDIVQTGGLDSNNSVSNLIATDPLDLNKIRTELKNAVNNLKYEGAVISEFGTTRLSDIASYFIAVPRNWDSIDAQYRAMKNRIDKSYNLFIRMLARKELITKILNEYPRNYFSTTGRKDLVKISSSLDDQIDVVLQQYQNITSNGLNNEKYNSINSNTKPLDNLVNDNLKIRDYLSKTFAIFGGWKLSPWTVNWDGRTSDGHRNFFRTATLTINLPMPELIKSVELQLDNGQLVKKWTKSKIGGNKIIYPVSKEWINKWTHHHNLIERVKGEITRGSDYFKQKYKIVVITQDLYSYTYPMGSAS